MNAISKLGLCGLSAGLSIWLAGCTTEKIKVDYVMPARVVKDVSKVNVVKIDVKANVKGNLGENNEQATGLIKQLLAMRLYKEGFYQVADGIWSNAEGASEMEKFLVGKSQHGYASLAAMGQGNEKVTLKLELDLDLDANPVQKELAFTLTTLPYKPKKAEKGKPPSSEPDLKAAKVENVKKTVTVYETVAKGTLKARFEGVNGGESPIEYANTFAVSMPEKDRFDSAQPSQLKALAAAVTPAINEIVADISPYRETRELVASKGGDKRIVYLLNAKAFSEVIEVAERLELTGKTNFADYENQGIAFEAMGDFFSARDAYEKAIKAKPESETAKAGQKRVENALTGKAAVKESGAKKNKDTKFSKE